MSFFVGVSVGLTALHHHCAHKFHVTIYMRDNTLTLSLVQAYPQSCDLIGARYIPQPCDLISTRYISPIVN